MKRFFMMIGEGEDNKTAFDFDTYAIKKDAVCTFRPGGSEYTLKVEWRYDGKPAAAYAAGEGGFVQISDRIWFTPDPEFKDALVETVLENRKDAGKVLDTPSPEDEDEDEKDEEDEDEEDWNGDWDRDGNGEIAWD